MLTTIGIEEEIPVTGGHRSGRNSYLYMAKTPLVTPKKGCGWFKSKMTKCFKGIKSPFKSKFTENKEPHPKFFKHYLVPHKKARPPVIWVMGGPGAPIQALIDRLADVYNFHHVVAGRLLKAEIMLGEDYKGNINELMNRGAVLPRKHLHELIQQDMADAKKTKKTQGFIFTDYPSNAGQAKTFDKKIRHVDYAMVLKFDEQTMKLNAYHQLRQQSLASKSLKMTKIDLTNAAEEVVERYTKDLRKIHKVLGHRMKVIDGQMSLVDAYCDLMKWMERAMILNRIIPVEVLDPPIKGLGNSESEENLGGSGGSINIKEGSKSIDSQ